MKFIRLNEKRWINLDLVNEVRLGLNNQLIISFSYATAEEIIYSVVTDPQEIELVIKALEA